jgi:hypothetical protein
MVFRIYCGMDERAGGEASPEMSETEVYGRNERLCDGKRRMHGREVRKEKRKRLE